MTGKRTRVRVFMRLCEDPTLAKLLRGHAGDVGLTLDEDEVRIAANEVYYRIAEALHARADRGEAAPNEQPQLQPIFDLAVAEVTAEMVMTGQENFRCPWGKDREPIPKDGAS